MNRPPALQRLIDARREVDAWDGGEFSSPPYHLCTEAETALAALQGAERESTIRGTIEALAAGDTDVRAQAARAAGVLGIASAADELVTLLGDADADVRDECVAALVKIAPERALPAVVEAGARVAGFRLEDAANAAVEALGAGALPWLARSDAGPLDAKRAWNRLYALDAAGCERALAARLATHDVRWVIGISDFVVQNGGAWAIPLFRQLANSSDSRLRSAAARAFAAIVPAPDDSIFQTLAKSRGGVPTFVALRAVFALGHRTQRPVAARAIQATPRDSASQQELFEHLSKIVHEPWEEESRPIVVQTVRRALLEQTDGKLLSAVVLTAARAEAFDVAPGVVRTLGLWNWYELSDSVDEYLRVNASGMRDALAAAIEEGLSDGADERDRATARTAAYFLGKTRDGGTKRAVLARAVREGPLEIRNMAAIALRMLEIDDDGLVAAAQLRTDEAILTLGHFRDERVVPIARHYLLELEDGKEVTPVEWYRVVLRSIEALALIGGPPQIDLVGQKLTHFDFRIRRDAAEALGKTKDRAAQPYLEPLLKDPHKQVKDAAQRALVAIGAKPGS